MLLLMGYLHYYYFSIQSQGFSVSYINYIFSWAFIPLHSAPLTFLGILCFPKLNSQPPPLPAHQICFTSVARASYDNSILLVFQAKQLGLILGLIFLIFYIQANRQPILKLQRIPRVMHFSPSPSVTARAPPSPT